MIKFIHIVFLGVFLFTPFLNAQNCVSGLAGSFPCLNVDLESRLDLKASGLAAEAGNDIWGWTDPWTEREYAIMGLSSKTSFVDITDPKAPIHLGDLPTHTRNSIWRDIKVYRDHAFIVSEAPRHGLQIFDLTQLRTVISSPAVTFKETAHYDLFGSAHNIAINEESGTAYVVGTNTCDAGMHLVDITIPTEPVFLNCVDKSIFTPASEEDQFAIEPLSMKHGDDYTHDVQCVNYKGPDTRYKGREICVASNATTVNIVDVTDKTKPVQISVRGYAGMGYTHQGWLTEDHKYFLLGDELDEMKQNHATKTLIWDLTDLEKPVYKAQHLHKTHAIDHNMYVKGNRVYQSNYQAGLRILNLDQIGEGILREVAFFDTYPKADDPQFKGAWSIFPYFKSGVVVISNIDGFLYVVKPYF